MSLRSKHDHLACIRDEARILAQSAGEHEQRLTEFAVASETFVHSAEAAFASASEIASDLGYLRSLLQAQLQRSAQEAASAVLLSAAARAQHDAARRLLAHLDFDDAYALVRLDSGLQRDAVLVCDDYRAMREVVATVLENAGFVVRTAENGLEALLAAYEMRPAVIIMDVSMPVLDGIEATRLIKASDAMRHSRVIAYTGSQGVEARVGRNGLFDAVLKKPALPEVVVSTVQQIAAL